MRSSFRRIFFLSFIVTILIVTPMVVANAASEMENAGVVSSEDDLMDTSHFIEKYYIYDEETGTLIEVPCRPARSFNMDTSAPVVIDYVYDEETGEWEEVIYTLDEASTDLYLIDNDNRFEVVNSTRFPYCTMVELIVTHRDASGVYQDTLGSGVLVGDRTVLTAGHNVCSKNYGEAVKIQVTPGGRASTSNRYYADSFLAASEWLDNFEDNYDYAVIHLEESPNVGYLETKVLSTATLETKSFIAYGYPGDKPRRGILWRTAASDQYLDTVSTNLFQFRGYVSGGMSGGPIVCSDDTETVVGILKGQKSVGPGYRGAVFTRITSSIQNLIEQMS